MHHLKGISMTTFRAILAAIFLVSAIGTAQAAKSQAVTEIEGYYQGVRSLYKEAAIMLGAAQGYAARKPIISVQRACATSLGGLRKVLDSGNASPATAAGLLPDARALHQSCERELRGLQQS